jgi:methylenetetrahydrofolate reductase (NADPH)
MNALDHGPDVGGAHDRDLPPFDLSVELFPPRTPAGDATLVRELPHLAALRPSFVSVTCGAGGSKAEGTAPLIQKLRSCYGLRAVPHLTCAGAPRAEIDRVARAYWDGGFREIVALRGDPPAGSGPYRPRTDGYAYAADLVAGLRQVADFEVNVACYPEVHPDAASAEADFENLRRKVDAGASQVITQYCFDTDRILRFRDRVAQAGIEVRFAAGVMPIHNFRQIRSFSERCGASVPAWLVAAFEGTENDAALHGMVAASVAAEQCRRLVQEGIDHLHVYALNRMTLTRALSRLLGRPTGVAAAAA